MCVCVSVCVNMALWRHVFAYHSVSCCEAISGALSGDVDMAA